jgi:replicative DNA helicase
MSYTTSMRTTWSLPPHSDQAEEAVVGAVPKRGLAIADVVPFLKQQHFYDARHRHIYDAMAALFDRAAAIDYHTIAEEPEHQGTYEQAGGQHLVTRGVPDHLIEDLNLDRPGISAGLGRLAEPS